VIELYTSAFDAATVSTVLETAGLVWGAEDDLLDVETVLDVLEELMDNAVRHSGEKGGSLSLLRYGRKLVARVEDSGVGIHRNMATASEERSVELAFEPGPVGTSTGSPMRGGGLWLALQSTAENPRLTLCLHTGSTVYAASNGEGYATSGSGDYHQGVLVELMCPVRG